MQLDFVCNAASNNRRLAGEARRHLPLLPRSAAKPQRRRRHPAAAAIPHSFLEAVGDWEAVDADGSYMLFSIRPIAGDEFAVHYTDYGASACGVAEDGTPTIGIEGDSSASASGVVLPLTAFELFCFNDRETVFGPIDMELTYDPLNDLLSDGSAINYRRIGDGFDGYTRLMIGVDGQYAEPDQPLLFFYNWFTDTYEEGLAFLAAVEIDPKVENMSTHEPENCSVSEHVRQF